MKKIVCIITAILMLAGIAAEGAGAYPPVLISGFEFTVNGAADNIISAGDDIGVKFFLEKAPYAEDEQAFCGILKITDKKGVIQKITGFSDVISVSDGKKEFSLELKDVPENIGECEITFSLVGDLNTFTPLAPIATFRSENPLIGRIIAGREIINYSDSSVFTAANPKKLDLAVRPSDIPVFIYVEPIDLSARVSYNDISSLGGLMKVSSASHSGTKQSATSLDAELVLQQNDQLKKLLLNGKPIDGFEKDKFRYVYLSDGEIPEITCETFGDETKVETEYPETVPGIAKIKVSDLTDESNSNEYSVIIAKKAVLPLANAARYVVGTAAYSAYSAHHITAGRTERLICGLI